ncbi:MAG: 4Fe-4S binding protein [Peptostreptococcaceae bacterium]|nr:4Fe-4S binding protein [Peptostreptococcaceae bacterium]
MTKKILVCCGTGCLANGSQALVDQFYLETKKLDVNIIPQIKETGCNGFCENGPMVTIVPAHITYYKVQPKDVSDILESLDKEPVTRLLYKDDSGKPVTSKEENPFYALQHKIVLRNTGVIDPSCFNDYLEAGGYVGLTKALAMEPIKIIEEVEKSGLRGRGGGGFSTGLKWRSCHEITGEFKYMLCNGDEGDPGAFMDRSIMEGDPHSVLEGLIIGAYAIGSHYGFLYIRDEYGLALKHMQKAIDDAKANGYLGNNILGSGFNFSCEIVRGGGAFVCGESSALMASIEGRVGEPRVKYIRSVEKGLFDSPTVLSNVESLANIPYIMTNGAENFASIGTKGSKGTKVFSLVGNVNRTGLIEVPMGITLRQLIFQIGGGIPNGKKFKAAQTGGPSGGCIPEELLDLEIDFDSLKEKGSIMGSGGIIVMDENTCMVELARYYMKFLTEESCGKCTPCREGLRAMLDILTRICEGKGELSDLDLLEELAYVTSEASLCELGKTAPNPVLSSLKYFRDEYLAHIVDKRCPAGVCPKLIKYEIIPDKCKFCGLCVKVCPVEAITGKPKTPYIINQNKCIRCGNCKSTCAFEAIYVE